MGYLIAMGPCCACGRVFAFNPDSVPSAGGRPICEECIRQVNARRRADGLPECVVYADSYGDGTETFALADGSGSLVLGPWEEVR